MSGAAPVKVLYVSPVGERGGAETALLNVLKYHDRQAFEPVVCLLQPGPLANDVRARGIRVVTIPAGRLRDARRTRQTIRELRALIAAEGARIVFGNMSVGHIYGGLAARGTAARAVWFQHGIPSRSDAVDWLAALVPCARIYVNSQASAAAQATLPGAARRMQLLYYGLDCPQFVPTYANGCRRLAALGIPHGSPTVAVVARFQRWKGQEVFLRAAARVAMSRPDARFLLVGDTLCGIEPGFKTSLQRLAADLGLADRVVFTGFREDVPLLLNELDIVVHPPIRPEPFGLAVAEALLMRKAVVAANHGGPAEIIQHGETGLLVPPGDVEALADGIRQLLADPARGQAMGEKGRAFVLERFGIDRMIRELETSYRDVLDSRAH
jgi:glycosyltransferase involved in cell wall biosynthesis